MNSSQLAQARAAVQVVSVQNRYNIEDRTHENVVETCTRNGLAFLPWYPLAAGALTGAGGLLDEIARRHKATRNQVALAWLLRRSPVMLPIPGTSSIAHFEENLAAASLRLTEDEVAALSALGSPAHRGR